MIIFHQIITVVINDFQIDLRFIWFIRSRFNNDVLQKNRGNKRLTVHKLQTNEVPLNITVGFLFFFPCFGTVRFFNNFKISSKKSQKYNGKVE